MKRLISLIAILLLVGTAYAVQVSKGGGGSSSSSLPADSDGYLKNASGVLSWDTPAGAGDVSYPAGAAEGDMFYYNGSALVRVPKGTEGQILTENASLVPTWTSTIKGTISDNEAQIVNSADSTKKVLIDASNQGAGETGTIQAPKNGTATLTAGTQSITVSSGQVSLGTAEIAVDSCASVVTSAATSVLTTDVILWSFSTDPTNKIGYSASSTGMLTILSYPSADLVLFKVCNNTGAAITPSATTLNWRVPR
jgi:hypothetical protein